LDDMIFHIIEGIIFIANNRIDNYLKYNNSKGLINKYSFE